MRILDVVNDMLGTMGEVPLNSLSDPHSFKGAALRALNKHDRAIQARGWWYNKEVFVGQPELSTGKIYLPTDTIAVRTDKRKLVQRGRTLYDTEKGTDIFTDAQTIVLIRLVPFEDLPESVAAYIAAVATHRFQIDYDGDSTKAAQLAQHIADTRSEARADDIRNSRANLIESNVRLQYIKSKVRQVGGRW